MTNHPLFQLVMARLREFIREPAAIFWVYGFPLVMAIALGLAFRSKPVEQDVNVDVFVAAESSNDNRQLILDALASDERFDVTESTREEWVQRLRTGKIDLVVIPAEAGTSKSTQFVFDETRPGSILARDAVNEAIQAFAGREDVVDVGDTVFAQPGGRYIDFLIPGLLGLSLMGGGLWGVGFAIVDLRIRKLLKRFVATPMKRSHFMMGIMISRMIFMIPEMILLVLFARFAFGVVVYGNWLTVVFLITLGAIEFSGIGLLISCRVKTLESVSGLMNLTMLPMWIASGIFFKAENFPEFMQPVINVLPLTPLVSSLRAVMMEGATLTSLGPELAIMSVWGAVTFAIALKFFRWE